jgi:gamma-glutamyltranspeptidase/glutathione hydrolase
MYRISAATNAFLVMLTAGSLLCRAEPPDSQRPTRQATSSRGIVVSVSAPASHIGAQVLRDGGNAVDAAVATAFALAVTYPPAGNIGGGGFMMVLPAPLKQPICIDYRETAPSAATVDMFTLDDSRLGPRAVGVPGTVRGLALAHAQFGRLPWARLVQPAARTARQGFEVGQSLANSLNVILQDKDSQPYSELLRVFAPPDGRSWRAGDRLRQPDLARTLERIANEGPGGFYAGPVAAAIVDEMKAGDGIITRQDLRDYRAKVRTAIHGTFRGYDIYGPPPPSSGGIVLVQMLNILEQFELRTLGKDSPETNHMVIEAMRRAFLDRARYLGDQDFVPIPDFLTSKRYARQLASQIDREAATPSESLAPQIRLAPEGKSTTHFSIIDQSGMAVSNTYTLEQSYGARVMVRGHGFLLNNEMGDFNWVAGHTDRLGRIGTRPNLIQPGKRMLSSQTPVLVLKDGRPRLIVGSPGGRTIINTVLCVILNHLEFEMSLPDAIAAPRLHHQWLPDQVRYEAKDQPDQQQLVNQLQAMGHTFMTDPPAQGDAHCIVIDPHTGQATGVADGRISGSAVAADTAPAAVAPHD